MKKFYMTSEFWVTLISNLVGIVVLADAITSDDANQIKNAAQQIVGGIMSLVAMIMYAKSRTDIKKAIIANLPVTTTEVEKASHGNMLKAAGV